MLDLARAPARRAVAGRLGGLAPVDAPGGCRRRHGRLGGRRRGSRSAHRRAAAAAAHVADGYELPPWAGPDTLVLCSSYSGDTEEVLACYDEALERGAPRRRHHRRRARRARAARRRPVIPLPGGFQPRAAVGYSLVAALEAAAWPAPRRRCGARSRPPPRSPEARRRVGAGRARGRRRQGARRASGRHGSGDHGRRAGRRRRLSLEVPVQREREVPAFCSALPELDHNEICGWPRRPRASSRPSSWRTRERTAEPAAVSSPPGWRRRRRVVERVRRAADRDGADYVARAARRPRVAVPRRAARRGPGRDRGDRPS